jgi:hypothetical protein
MSLTPPESVQKLRSSLHAKAKGSPGYRFYALYDKVYRADVLAFAYRCCKANKGAAGVDGQTFEDIEAYGLKRWLDELQKAYQIVDTHVGYRLRMWLNAKHKVRCVGKKRFIDAATACRLGLDRLAGRKGSLPWATA